jgi:hypothetical protein
MLADNIGISSVLGNHRTKTSRYLKKLLTTLSPHLTEFKPYHTKKTFDFCANILAKFSDHQEPVNDWIQNLTVSTKTRQSRNSRFGIYLDTIYGLFQEGNIPGIPTHLKKEFITLYESEDQAGLLDCANKNSSILEPFWDLCVKSGRSVCQVDSTYKDLYNYFSSPDVQQDVETKTLHEIYFKGVFRGIPVHFKVFVDPLDSRQKLNRRKIHCLLKRCGLMIALIPNLRKNGEVRVTIWLTDKKKLLSWPSNGYLGILNVNSGCTIRDRESPIYGRVMIWRSEESEKVLVHELIHSLGFDCPHNDTDIDEIVYLNYGINSPDFVNLFECYTETWTVIMSSCIYSLTSGRADVNEVLSLIRDETLFSIYQAAKILVFFGYKNIQELTLDTKHRKFNQGSSILSYYLFKSSILYSLDKFADFCWQHNSQKTPWKFKAAQEVFWNLIQDCFRDPSYQKQVNECMSFFGNRQILDQSFGLCSLRMTLSEFI